MESPVESNDNFDSSAYEELMTTLKNGYDIGLTDYNKYLFQSLYSQVFKQIKDRTTDLSFGEFSNEIRELFCEELAKVNEKTQSSYEIIMSNEQIKSEIVDAMSKYVYNRLRDKTSEK